MTLNQTLATIGISALGVKMPRLAPRWTTSGMPTPTSDGLALTLSAGEWVCPVPAMVERVTTASMSVTLVDATGAPVSAPGLLLTIFPETRLRLRRLYGQLLESTPPENGRSSRPVPAHLWIAGTPPDGPELGNHAAGDDLGVSGRLSIHDQDGFPIDPLAVASAFVAVLGAHDLLASSAFDASSSPIVDLATSAGTPSSVRVRLTGHDGRPIRSALAGHLTGLTVVDASSGLYSLDATAGGGSDLTGTVGKATGTDAAGAFPDDERRLIKLGLGTLGRMSESVTFPALPAGRTLARDYFSLRVVELRPYLLGSSQPRVRWDQGRAATHRTHP